MHSAAKDGREVMALYGFAGNRPAARILAEVRSIRARDRGEAQRMSRELPTRATANQLVDETPTSLELLGCTVRTPRRERVPLHGDGVPQHVTNMSGMTPAAINHVAPLSNRVLVELLDRAEREERQLRHHTRSEEHLDLHQQIEALRLEKHRRLDSLRAPLAALA